MSNSKYIRLQELVIDSFNLETPVEIEKGALLLDSTSKTVLLQLRLNILDDINAISSISITIHGFSDSGEVVEGFAPFTHTYSDIYLQGNKSFGDRTPIILDPRIRKVIVAIEKVVYRNGEVWRNAVDDVQKPVQKSITSIDAELLPQFQREISSLSEADRQRFLYIPQQFDDYWICTCGMANKNVYSKCRRCGLQSQIIFAITNEETLQRDLGKFIEDTRNAEELRNGKIRIAEERRLKEEEEKKVLDAKRGRQLRSILIPLFVVISLLALFVFVIQPSIKYSRATSLLENKDFDGAISAFTALEDYKDSSDMVKKSTYQKGIDLLGNKMFEESSDVFLSLGEYQDSLSMVEEVNYQRAVDLLNANEFDGAVSVFTALGDYKDSSDMVEESKYQKATYLFTNGLYDEAISIFSQLADYNDSNNKVIESNYQKSVKLLAEKSYDDAISIFSSLIDYQDSEELVNESKYQKAVDIFNDGEFVEDSYGIFSEIAEYKDSSVYILEILYIIGNRFLNEDNFEQAVGFFTDCGDYKDSADLLLESKYLLAQQYLDQYSYFPAQALFEELKDYKESKSLLAQTLEGVELEEKYNSAVREYLNGSFNDAKTVFSTITDYRESESYINKIAVLNGIQGTWVPYTSFEEGEPYDFLGWTVYHGYSWFEQPNILPEEVTESSIKYYEYRGVQGLEIVKDYYILYDLATNTMVSCNPEGSDCTNFRKVK